MNQKLQIQSAGTPTPLIFSRINKVGYCLFAGSDSGISCWDPETGMLVWNEGECDYSDKEYFDLAGGECYDLTLIPLDQGQAILVAATEHGLACWNALNGDPLPIGATVGETTRHSDTLWSVSNVILEGGNSVVCGGGNDGRLYRWNARTRAPIGRPIYAHKGPILSLASIGKVNGSYFVATASDDGRIHRWNVETGREIGRPLKTLDDESGFSDTVSFTLPGGQVGLVAGDSEGVLYLWDAITGAAIGNPISTDLEFLGMETIYIDGNPFIIISSEDEPVRIWDMRSESFLMGPRGRRTSTATIEGDYGISAIAGEEGEVSFYSLSNFR